MRHVVDGVAVLEFILGMLLIWASDNLLPHAPWILGPMFLSVGIALLYIGMITFITNPPERG